MQIDLTPEQDELVRRAIAAGRFARPEEAVTPAMTLWAEAERERAELIASLDEADAEYECGDFIRIETEDQRRAFVDDVMRRVEARLAGRPDIAD